MLPSFITFLNKAGVACAADTDGAVYKLAKKEPFAVAVNPLSPIPWEEIISEYKQQGEPETQILFSGYVMDFNSFLGNIAIEDDLKNLSPDDLNIVFMGYGSEDLYPSVIDCMVGINEEGRLCVDESSMQFVTIDNHRKFTYNFLGDFESVATILWGSTKKTMEYFKNEYFELYQIYRQRILEKVKGLDEEEAVKQHLAAFDAEAFISDALNNEADRVFGDLRIGVDAFSVQDMVDAVETLVNSNVKLNRLKSGERKTRGDVKEIAVITRAEGFTWLKHSIYAQ